MGMGESWNAEKEDRRSLARQVTLARLSSTFLRIGHAWPLSFLRRRATGAAQIDVALAIFS